MWVADGDADTKDRREVRQAERGPGERPLLHSTCPRMDGGLCAATTILRWWRTRHHVGVRLGARPSCLTHMNVRQVYVYIRVGARGARSSDLRQALAHVVAHVAHVRDVDGLARLSPTPRGARGPAG